MQMSKIEKLKTYLTKLVINMIDSFLAHILAETDRDIK